MRIWRICRAPHAAEAFSGEGARRFGGRWNSRGIPMVYASTSLALAAIELFVHLEPGLAPNDLVCIAAQLPQGEPARTLQTSDLPPAWWTDAASAATRELGDAWIRTQSAASSSLAMMVPSVPIRSEWNVLVNPLHPRIKELQIDPPQPFIFDARMFQPTQTS
ncbi:MAG: RES family NAD+ phosphorylase [Terracidiphilus sp.]|jgi:RES domain-containing protein